MVVVRRPSFLDSPRPSLVGREIKKIQTVDKNINHIHIFPTFSFFFFFFSNVELEVVLNGFNDIFDVEQNLFVSETDDSESQRLQSFSPHFVAFFLLWFGMITAIDFDDEFARSADEIDNVTINDVLS